MISKKEFVKIINEVSKFDDDMEFSFDKHDENNEVEEESSVPTDDKGQLKKDIEPQVTIANSILESIHNSTQNNCDGVKKITQMEDQVKNWKKQIRGACDQVVSVVESSGVELTKMNSSPKALTKIKNSTSRDLSVLDLCIAIIVFSNSLG